MEGLGLKCQVCNATYHIIPHAIKLKLSGVVRLLILYQSGFNSDTPQEAPTKKTIESNHLDPVEPLVAQGDSHGNTRRWMYSEGGNIPHEPKKQVRALFQVRALSQSTIRFISCVSSIELGIYPRAEDHIRR